jgi:hypothetical protein
VLDLRRLALGEIGVVGLPRHRGHHGRGGEQVRHGAGGRALEQSGRARQRVGQVRRDRPVRQVGVEAIQRVAQRLLRLPHQGRPDHAAERVVRVGGAVPVRVHDQRRLEHAVVVPALDERPVRVPDAGRHAVVERVADLLQRQVVPVVRHRRCGAERVDVPPRQEEVRRRLGQLLHGRGASVGSVRERRRGHPPAAVALAVRVAAGPVRHVELDGRGDQAAAGGVEDVELEVRERGVRRIGGTGRRGRRRVGNPVAALVGLRPPDLARAAQLADGGDDGRAPQGQPGGVGHRTFDGGGGGGVAGRARPRAVRGRLVPGSAWPGRPPPSPPCP